MKITTLPLLRKSIAANVTGVGAEIQKRLQNKKWQRSHMFAFRFWKFKGGCKNKRQLLTPSCSLMKFESQTSRTSPTEKTVQ